MPFYGSDHHLCKGPHPVSERRLLPSLDLRIVGPLVEGAKLFNCFRHTNEYFREGKMAFDKLDQNPHFVGRVADISTVQNWQSRNF